MTDITLPFERGALSGKPMPEGLSLSDMCAYQALANLSSRFGFGGVSKEQATEEKNIIKRQWNKQREQEDYFVSRCKQLAELFRDTELARSEYRKAKTPEQLIAAADRFMEILDGMPVRHGATEI